MTSPTLPQADTTKVRDERARALAWAKEVYTWTHSHTYRLPDDRKLTLEGLALLAIDAKHPFPCSQNPSVIQIFEILTTIIELLGLFVTNVTDLLDVGAVRRDEPPPPSFLAPPSSPAPSSRGIVGEIREVLTDSVDVVGDAVGSLVHQGEEVLDHAADVVDCLRGLCEFRPAFTRILDRAEDAVTENGEPPPDLVGDLATDLNLELGRLIRLIVHGGPFLSVLERAGLHGRASSIEQYGRQFQTITVPNVAGDGMSDALFARMRIAGPNPLLLTRMEAALPSNFPVDPNRFERLTGQELDTAIAAGRAYMVDYAPLADVVPGVQPAGQKYICAPLGLFVLDEEHQRLSPVAIQLGQTPGDQVPVFYRDDGTTWEIAKLHVQSADGNYHELISHLGLTHLLLEPFAVATHRNLAQRHPVYSLLLPHFQGTLFINWSAVVSLVAPGGGVDQLLAGTIESDWKVTTDALASLDFNTHMLPNNLAARGVDDPELLPDYPYRDDALLSWKAIEIWVSEYLSVYYEHDQAIADDSELQNWYTDLVSPEGGCIKGLGEFGEGGEVGLFTRDYLVRVLTMIIFTASVQHATVNFPQLYIMSYSPAMPLATYAPPPTAVDPALPPDAILGHLPPLQLANYQLFLGQLLGSVYFTRLGRYDLYHEARPWFKDPRVAAPLERFQQRLVEIEGVIAARNLERVPYETLLPSRIPQSTNI